MRRLILAGRARPRSTLVAAPRPAMVTAVRYQPRQVLPAGPHADTVVFGPPGSRQGGGRHLEARCTPCGVSWSAYQGGTCWHCGAPPTSQEGNDGTLQAAQV